MNPDLNTSPLTSAQSWIVENISSLISSNHDDENDCTLTFPGDNNKYAKSGVGNVNGLNCDLEVEQARGHNEADLLTERISKRPLSPEIIAEDQIGFEQLGQIYNNAIFNANNQLVSFKNT